MSTVVDELVTLLGFKLSPESVNSIKKYTDYLGKAKEHAEKLYVGLMTAGAAVQAFAMKNMLSGSELYKFGELVDQNTESIQKWAYAMEQAGGSGDSMKNDMSTLAKALRPVMPGEYNQGLYGLLGFDYTSLKDVDSLMAAIGKRMQGMSQIKAANWASQIGLSPEFAVLMRKNGDEIKKTMEELEAMGGVATEENLEKSRAFEKQYDKIKTALTGVSQNIAGELAPAMTDLLIKFQKWLTINKDWLSSKITEGMHIFDQAIRRAAETIQWMIVSIQGLLAPFEKYVELVDWAKIALASLTGATIAFAVATIAATWPWLLLGTGIAAAGYVIYDAIQYFRDMGVETDTLTGKVVEFANKFKEQFPGITSLVTSLYNTFKMLANVLVSIVTNITTPIFKLIENIVSQLVTGIDKALQKAGYTKENAGFFAKDVEALTKQGEEGAKIMADGINHINDNVTENAPHLFDNLYKEGKPWGSNSSTGTTAPAMSPENKNKERREERNNDNSAQIKIEAGKTNSLLQSVVNGINNISMMETFNLLSSLGGPGFLQELLSPTVPGSGSGMGVPYAPNLNNSQNNVFNINAIDPKGTGREVSGIMKNTNEDFGGILQKVFPGSFRAPLGS